MVLEASRRGLAGFAGSPSPGGDGRPSVPVGGPRSFWGPCPRCGHYQFLVGACPVCGAPLGTGTAGAVPPLSKPAPGAEGADGAGGGSLVTTVHNSPPLGPGAGGSPVPPWTGQAGLPGLPGVGLQFEFSGRVVPLPPEFLWGDGEGPEAPAGGPGGQDDRQVTLWEAMEGAERVPMWCPDATWRRGECEHGEVRWVRVPCKRRDCPHCGALGRYRIAERIAYGLRVLAPVWRARNGSVLRMACWMVLTFAEDVEKGEADKALSRFIKALRRRVGRFEYACTWEHQQSGRWHLNLLCAPWPLDGVPQRELSELWGRCGGGPVVWVCWVRDEGAIGKETAKARKVDTLAGYLSKLHQAAREGRRATFSRGWPVLPDSEWERKGKIRWERVSYLSQQWKAFREEVRQGWWKMVAWGEWGRVGGEVCDCYQWVIRRDILAGRAPPGY